MSRLFAIVPVLSVVAALSAPQAHAQSGTSDKRVHLGVQGSFGENSDFGVGARAIFDLSGHRAGLTGIASFDYFFVGDDGLGSLLGLDVNYWEANGNIVYAFSRSGSVQPYIGAGLNLAHASLSTDIGGVSTSDIGVNALGGINFGKSGRLFAEARLELGGGEQFVATVGVRF